MPETEVPKYRVKVDSSTMDATGVDLISMVTFPAIERNFLALSDQKKQMLKSQASKHQSLNVDEMEGVVTGPALIPGFEIFRWDESTGPYYIEFEESTIRTIRDKFFKNSFQNRTNEEHYIPLAGNTVVESWIIEDFETDKAKALGFAELPKGTWMVSVKVEDRQYFKDQV